MKPYISLTEFEIRTSEKKDRIQSVVFLSDCLKSMNYNWSVGIWYSSTNLAVNGIEHLVSSLDFGQKENYYV